jgi:hypothetical protein
MSLAVQAAIPPEVVVIQPERDARSPDVLVASCSATLGRGRCRAGTQGDSEEPSVWYAVVVWLDAEHLRARVQFRRRGELWAQRDVEFNATDSTEQRERALGLIVAAYAMGSQASAPEEPASQPGDPAPKVAPAPARPTRGDVSGAARDDGGSDDETASAPSSYGVDTGVFLGPGLDRGASRVGILVRPWLRPFTAPLVGLVQVRGSMRPDDPLVTWLSASLGVGGRLEPQDSLVAVELHLEAVGERLIASAEDPSGARESKGVYRFGGRLGGELQIPQRTPVSGFVGVEGSLLRPRVDVSVADRSVGSEPPVSWAVLLGLRTSY